MLKSGTLRKRTPLIEIQKTEKHWFYQGCSSFSAGELEINISRQPLVLCHNISFNTFKNSIDFLFTGYDLS